MYFGLQVSNVHACNKNTVKQFSDKYYEHSNKKTINVNIL